MIAAMIATILLLLLPAIIGACLCLNDKSLTDGKKAALCIYLLPSGLFGLLIYLIMRKYDTATAYQCKRRGNRESPRLCRY